MNKVWLFILAIGAIAAYLGHRALFGFEDKVKVILPPDFVKPVHFLETWPAGQPTKHFINYNGNRLAEYAYLTQSNVQPRALLFLINGYGDYCATMAHEAKYNVDNGYPTFCIDTEGFGNSDGLRAYFTSFNRSWSDELISFVHRTVDRHPQWRDLPKFAIGGSLGGLNTVITTLRAPSLFKGMVLHAPALELDANLYPFLRKIVHWLAALWPTLSLGEPLGDAAQMHSDKNCELAMASDPLVYHGSNLAGTSAAILDTMELIDRGALRHVKTPFLVLHGTLDQVIPLSTSRRLLNEAPVQDKELVELEGEYHDTVHGPSHAIYFERQLKWIEARL